RHDREWSMIYQDHPPYQVLSTSTLDFSTLQRLGRFSHFWDLIANSGNFSRTLELLKGPSLFAEFDELSIKLSRRHPQGHGVALLNLVESVWISLRDSPGMNVERLREALLEDYCGRVRRDPPVFLREGETKVRRFTDARKSATPARQRRHLAA